MSKWIAKLTDEEIEQLEKALRDLKDRGGCDCGQ